MGIGQVGENSNLVVIMEEVRVKVPKKSEYMKFCPEVRKGSDEAPVVIPDRWHNSFMAGYVVVNQNFYGISKSDLGRKITTTVQVFEKTVNGECYTHIDIFKVNDGSSHQCELRIREKDTGLAVPILGTQKFICFE